MNGSEEVPDVGVNEQQGDTSEAQVTTHRSSPDRTVFTEEGNTDAWIATDLTVRPER